MVTERNVIYVAVLSLSPSNWHNIADRCRLCDCCKRLPIFVLWIRLQAIFLLVSVDGARNGLSWYDAVLIPGDEPC